MQARLAAFAALALITVALSGCTAIETGSASIYVKDAPTDEFAEIHVVFTEVRVHASGNASENGTAGWQTIVENGTGIDVDLLNASGDRAAFLGETGLSAGKYTQLRIIVAEAFGIDHDGVRHNFTIPSGTLKLNRPFTVEADQETRIILDFDLDKSLKQNPQGWRMTPVVGQTLVEVVEDSESGAEVHEEGEIASIENP